MRSLATIPVCCGTVKSAIDNIKTNELGCVLIKLYLLKTGSGPDMACEPHILGTTVLRANTFIVLTIYQTLF